MGFLIAVSAEASRPTKLFIERRFSWLFRADKRSADRSKGSESHPAQTPKSRATCTLLGIERGIPVSVTKGVGQLGHLCYSFRRQVAASVRAVSTPRQRQILWKAVHEIPLQIEASSLARRILGSVCETKDSLELVVHLHRTPPTLGDFVAIIVLCRVLKQSGYSIVLRINDRFGVRRDWGIEGVQQKNGLLQTWSDLFEWAGSSISVDDGTGWQFSVGAKDEQAQVKIAGQEVPTKGDLYVLAPRVLAAIWRQSKVDAVKEAFFLDSKTDTASLSRDRPLDSPYITWHIRGSAYSAERNLGSDQILDSFLRVCSLSPSAPILLLSDKVTSRRVKDLIHTDNRTIALAQRLVTQPKEGFVNAASYALGSVCHVQELGGGISQPIIFSRVPYFISSLNKGSFPEPRAGKAMPFSTDFQGYYSVNGSRTSAKLMTKYLAFINQAGLPGLSETVGSEPGDK